jgi:hypothetical protein
MIESLDPQPQSPNRKDKDKASPDQARFEKELKVDKVDETEFEGKKAKKTKEEEEAKGVKESKKTNPSPYQVEFHKNIHATKETQELEIQELTSEEKKILAKEKAQAPPQIIAKTEKKQKKTEAYFQPEEKKNPDVQPISKEGLDLIDKEKRQSQKKDVKRSYYEGAAPHKNPFAKKDKDDQIQVSPQKGSGLAIDHTSQAQASALTSKISSYLDPSISQLFDKMVGTIIQINKEGITQTQVILNSPSFANSIFFESKIFFEKYSTAPDSFNIRLTGPPYAVSMFNSKLDQLELSFKKSGMPFRIGRLSAEYETEKSLFRRKKSIADEEAEGN